MGLSHLDEQGRARMVDVAAKPETDRLAVATGRILMSAATLDLVTSGAAPKGDVAAVARIAGIQAAKQAAHLVPLCHPLHLTHVAVDVTPEADGPGLRVTSTVRTHGQTGAEIEALTAVAVALVTIYDMLKAVERGMTIEAVRLVEKRGGVHGDWKRGETA